MTPPPDPHDDHDPHPPHHDRPHDHGDGPNGDDADRYLYVVDYDDDAERKRAEYLFDTWDEGTVERPDGVVRIAEGVDGDALHRDLLVKFRSEQVDVYELAARDDPATPEARTVERTLDAPPDAAESFLQYLVSRKKGERRADGEYEVYTNKGRADVSLDVRAADDGTAVTVRISGHPPVLDYLTSYVETELSEFAASR